MSILFFQFINNEFNFYNILKKYSDKNTFKNIKKIYFCKCETN